MLTNYHTHTTRCGHAEGTEEEYILTALRCGFKVLGFSDHTPWAYATPGFVSRIRMLPSQLDDYVLRRGIQELIRIVEPQLDRNWKGLPGVERLLRTDLPYCSSDGIVIPPEEQKDPRHDTSQIAGKSRTRGLFSDNV